MLTILVNLFHWQIFVYFNDTLLYANPIDLSLMISPQNFNPVLT